MASKRKVSKKDVDKMMPQVKKFNSIAQGLVRLLGFQVEQKEKRISIMVSRIAKPGDKKNARIDVTSIDVSKDFIKRQREQERSGKRRPGAWNSDFSSQKGTII